MAESAPESSSPDPSALPHSAATLDDLISRVTDLTGDIAQEVGAGSPAATRVEQATRASAAELDAILMADGSKLPATGGPSAPSVPTASKGKVIQLGKSTPQTDKGTAIAAAPPTSTPVRTMLRAPVAAGILATNECVEGARIDAGWITRCVGGVLDWCDRPFGWCGPLGRLLAGWAAVAIFFAAALVFGMSFLP